MRGILRKLFRPGRIGGIGRFLAVDFDSRQLRIVRVNRLGLRPRLRKFHAEDIPETLDIQDPSQVGEFLAATLKRRRIGGYPLIMNVPRGQAVLKPLHLPPGTDRSEIAGMVRFQVQGDLPFPGEEGVLDFTIGGESSGGEGPDGLDVLAAAIRQGVLEFYKHLGE
ncbi:MAG: pilus assembly protein PilM, partial [Candidatus Hydrogenedentes bacterium]|nr:pilus assembly protein PilM [Candidatus Hydrogenedentota bacterium]